MEKKIILFQGGSHGNFLCRYLDVADGNVNDFDFYKNHNGAHHDDKEISHNFKFLSYHRYDVNENIYIYILITQKDLYKLMWHTFYAAGEFGLDLLDNSDDFDLKFQKKVSQNQTHAMVADNISYKNFSKDQNGLREFFKCSFKQTNGFLTVQKKIIKNHKIENLFEFSWFYNTEEFFVDKIKKLLNNDCIVASNNFKIFQERKKNIIDSEQKVYAAFNAFLNNQHYNLEHFCLYEQAYFDHLIEEYYGITLKTFYEHYPLNTLEYQVREDK